MHTVVTSSTPSARHGVDSVTVVPFRLIVITQGRQRSSHVITLDVTPEIGDHLGFRGETVVVHYVARSSRNGFAGVIVAGER